MAAQDSQPLETPNITVAQVIAGIPVLANFASAFGLFTLTATQTTSLNETLVFSFGLLFADGIIRHGRSRRFAPAPEVKQ